MDDGHESAGGGAGEEQLMYLRIQLEEKVREASLAAEIGQGLMRRNREIAVAAEELETENDAMRAQVAELQAQLDAQRAQNGRLRRHIADLEERAAEEEEDVSRLQRRCDDALAGVASLARIREENARLHADADVLRDEAQRLRAVEQEHRLCAVRLASSDDTVAMLRYQLGAANEEIERLRRVDERNVELERQTKALAQRLERTRQSNELLQEEVADAGHLRAELSTAAAARRRLESLNEELREEIGSVRSQLSVLEDSMAAADADESPAGSPVNVYFSPAPFLADESFDGDETDDVHDVSRMLHDSLAVPPGKDAPSPPRARSPLAPPHIAAAVVTPAATKGARPRRHRPATLWKRVLRLASADAVSFNDGDSSDSASTADGSPVILHRGPRSRAASLESNGLADALL